MNPRGAVGTSTAATYPKYQSKTWGSYREGGWGGLAVSGRLEAGGGGETVGDGGGWMSGGCLERGGGLTSGGKHLRPPL